VTDVEIALAAAVVLGYVAVLWGIGEVTAP
jgi:hypothetical protein